MKTLGAGGRNGLKLAHLIFSALWIGGVCALIPMAFSVDTTDLVSTRTTYLNLRAIAWNVVGWGGIGSFLTGLAIGLLTSWGLFKKRWTTAKLGLTVSGILFGMFFVERHMLTGLAILESGEVSRHVQFEAHHSRFLLGVLCQLGIFALILGLAVYKPSLRSRGGGARKRASTTGILNSFQG